MKRKLFVRLAAILAAAVSVAVLALVLSVVISSGGCSHRVYLGKGVSMDTRDGTMLFSLEKFKEERAEEVRKMLKARVEAEQEENRNK